MGYGRNRQGGSNQVKDMYACEKEQFIKTDILRTRLIECIVVMRDSDLHVKIV